MILPADADIEKDSVEVLSKKLQRAGYDKSAADYLAGKLKGTIEDDNPIF